MRRRCDDSPGVIDGRGGDNFKKALAAYQGANGLDRSARLDDATSGKLTQGADRPVLADYAVTAEDLKGPFVPNQPRRLEDMAGLPNLAYASPREELAEKFHLSEDLLQQLNPSTRFQPEGTHIVVANVAPSSAARPRPAAMRATATARATSALPPASRSTRASAPCGCSAATAG